MMPRARQSLKNPLNNRPSRVETPKQDDIAIVNSEGNACQADDKPRLSAYQLKDFSAFGQPQD